MKQTYYKQITLTAISAFLLAMPNVVWACGYSDSDVSLHERILKNSLLMSPFFLSLSFLVFGTVLRFRSEKPDLKQLGKTVMWWSHISILVTMIPAIFVILL